MERYNLVNNFVQNDQKNIKSRFGELKSLIKGLSQNELDISCNNEPFRRHKVTYLTDDFYTNLVSWSKNCIVYAVEKKIFFFNFYTSKNQLIHTFENKNISSIYFNSEGDKLAIGTNTGVVSLLDINTLKSRNYRVHRSRIGVMEWNGETIFTGSRDRQVKLLDFRSSSTRIWLSSHQQEVCGLKLNCKRDLLASGGNDNLMIIYDCRMQKYPQHIIKDHCAAVKALSWSQKNPYSIVSGGGTADKTIKMWNLGRKEPIMLKNIDIKSQVCNLHWTNSGHIISTHGYSQNDSRIFSENLQLERINRGHKNRIVHFAASSDEKYYLTGSSDNVLNIWRTIESTKDLKFR